MTQDAQSLEKWFTAAQHGDTATLAALLTAHPELANAENGDGLTLLGYAAHFGQSEAAALLLDYGADVNAVSHSKVSYIPSNTALHAALAGERSTAVIRLLLGRGAATNIADSDGQFALHSAAYHTDQAEIIALLLQHGADPSAMNANGRNALEIALERGHETAAACLREALGAQ